jgi:hypothetical protein
VKRLVVCLDADYDYENNRQVDASLVPFGDTVLAATGATPPNLDLEHGDAWDNFVVKTKSQLLSAFGILEGKRSVLRECIKTEHNGERPSLQPIIYAADGDNAHGIEGLTVALPGKASLIFDLADLVVDEIAPTTHSPARCSEHGQRF